MSAPSAYDEAVSHLYGLSPRGVDLGLDRVRAALSALGDPHRGMRFVHVAGTNGKGSVCALLERMLRESGHKTGLYTSPHLHRFVERIQIDGRPIDDAELVRSVERLRRTRGVPELTFFEAATVLAFECFRAADCDVVVLEVGLGGRLDATNVVDPILSVVTNVGLDHVAYLGDTLEAIAAEKAAIAKPGRMLVSGVEQAPARAVVADVARRLGARLVELETDARIDGTRETGICVRWGARAIDDVPLVLAGDHQRRNLAVALLVVLALRDVGVAIGDPAVRRGAAAVRWPGRLETLEGAPPLLLDGAHNADGCRALAHELATRPSGGPRVLVFGAMRDKELEPMLRAFDGVVDHRVYVAPDLARAIEPSALAAIVPGHAAADVREGLSLATRLAGPGGQVVVAGSLFVVAAVRALALGLRADPPIAM